MKQKIAMVWKPVAISFAACLTVVLLIQLWRFNPSFQIVARSIVNLGQEPSEIVYWDEGNEMERTNPYALPEKLLMRSGSDRLGTLWDDDAMSANMLAISRILGEVLGSALEATSVSESFVLTALSLDHVFFEYTGAIPLSALAKWNSSQTNKTQN
jgi:hypothetical protein